MTLAFGRAGEASVFLLQFDKEEVVEFSYTISENGKKAVKTFKKKTVAAPFTADQKKKILDGVNKVLGFTQFAKATLDENEAHDAVVDFTDSRSPRGLKNGTIKGSAFTGNVGESGKPGAWVYHRSILDRHVTNPDEVINATINVAAHEIGHLLGLGHNSFDKQDVMTAPAKSLTKVQWLRIAQPNLFFNTVDNRRVFENKGKLAKPGQILFQGVSRKHAIGVVLGNFEPDPDLDFIDASVDFDFALESHDNPSKPFDDSFSLGFLDELRELFLMMTVRDIVDGFHAASFLGGDEVALALRDSTGNVYSALTGNTPCHGTSTIFSPVCSAQSTLISI